MQQKPKRAMRYNTDRVVRVYLKQIKEDYCCNTQQFAEKLGISASYLKKVEDDIENKFSVKTLVSLFTKISELTHISVFDLMIWETEYQLGRREAEKVKEESEQNVRDS